MKRLRLLLLPSLSSSVLCFGLAAFILGAGAWAYIEENQLFYEYLFGTYGFKTALLNAPDELWTWQNVVLGSSATYTVLILVCGAVAGLATYTVLEVAGHVKRGAGEVLHDIQTPGSAYHKAALEAFERLGLRVLSLMGWAVYTVAFAAFLLPSSILLVQIGIDKLSTSMHEGWLLILGGGLLLAVCLHVHIVFARLTLLRPRLFGDSAIEEAGED